MSKQSLSKRIFWLVGLASLSTAFMYWGVVPAGNCGENELFRTKFGIHACHTNDEAGGWQCFRQYGDVRHYVGLAELNCDNPLQKH